METTYLRTFLLVVESGSMSEAARRLDLTPAAVAHQIRLVESELGCRVLTRSGRTVVPTEAGHRILQRSRSLVKAVSELKASASEDVAAGELQLGAINTALHSILPEVLTRLMRIHPEAPS